MPVRDLFALMLLFLEQYVCMYVCMYVFISFLIFKSDVIMGALEIKKMSIKIHNKKHNH